MDRIERLKDFLKSSPDDSFLQHALALEYIKIGDDEQAKKQFQQLLQQNESYVGSYYHLAKLLERNDEKETAIAIYQKGMLKAREAGDNHAYNELQSAYEDLIDL
jgi:Tfp pilus assembly protein PilF